VSKTAIVGRKGHAAQAKQGFDLASFFALNSVA
jgi:hypothetical protein